MKTIIMEATINYMAFLGMGAEIIAMLNNSEQHETRTGVRYFILNEKD